MLILHEATSSVDTPTEVLVQKAMSALQSDLISFVIAHRLSTIPDTDLIVVMEAGRSWSKARTPHRWPRAGHVSGCKLPISRLLRWRYDGSS